MTAKHKNVFVLTIGRTGSNTFAKACSYITNYSSGHETRSWEIGESRLDYSHNHIEVDNKLCWMLGLLDEKYENEAYYIHLVRNKAEVVESWNQRWNLSFSNIRFFAEGVLSNVPELLSDADKLIVSEQYYDTVEANIKLFLKDKQHQLTIEMEDIENGFSCFWEEIGAEGNLPAALAEFKIKHNKTVNQKSVEQKERIFRLSVKEKVLLKTLQAGGGFWEMQRWRVQLLWVKLQLAGS
ncbi:MAG: hypothetical protein K9G41_03645 [Flavobacteriales bacterium]|nr:hypothetical protein [Flavobacteriales bacterium]